LAQAYKICPICTTRTHRSALICPTCGASLADVAADSPAKRKPGRAAYDARLGEADFVETEAPNRLGIVFTALALLIPLVLGVIVVAVFGSRFVGEQLAPRPTADAAVPVLPSPTLLPLATNTPRPPVVLPTVTLPPPSATATATPGPCIVTVRPGDDLITLASACGHRSIDVIPLILEMNDLQGAAFITAGQVLSIPLPTPTPAEGASAGAQEADGAIAMLSAVEEAELPTRTPSPIPTEALLPGIMWHIVQPNENMLSIAFQYSTNAEVLSQLNPEIAFSQCDFSLDTGGPRCTVLLGTGQRMRVPAPTPTPTLSPTLSGSETATPTLTPTYNAPSPLSPSDRVLFERDQLVTLRWTASGLLAAGEAYRVEVTDVTASIVYSALTTDLFFIVPPEWQSAEGLRHDYTWSVGVVSTSAPDQPRFTTPPRSFTWQGRGQPPTPTPAF
jgi:hypothetical protein